MPIMKSANERKYTQMVQLLFCFHGAKNWQRRSRCLSAAVIDGHDGHRFALPILRNSSFQPNTIML